MNDKNTPIIIEFIIIYEVGRCSFVLFTGNQIGFFFFTLPFFIAKVLAHAMLIYTMVLFLRDCE